MTLRDSAVALARRGFYVFRLRPGTKYPAFKGWQAEATNDPVKVHGLWTTGGAERQYNIGIATGREVNGKFHLVVDVDSKDAAGGPESVKMLEAIFDEQMPNTFRVRSSSGGWHDHLLAEHAVGNSASKLASGIDVRGVGGYVVGPGSVRNGKSYDLISDAPLADAPSFVSKLAGKPRDKKLRDNSDVELDTEANITRAIDYLENRAPEAREGEGGNHTTYKVFCELYDRALSLETAVMLALDHWNETKADPPWNADDLETVAKNAYSYAQNTPGAKAPETEFDAVEIDENKAPPRPRFYGIRWADGLPDLEQQYLIDDVVDLGTMVVTYGDSNVGKTYVKLDQCFHVAAGREWNGHKVKQGLVVYVAAEGGRGFLKRIAAFKKHYGVTDLPFTLVPCPIDLQSDRADTKKLIDLVRAEETHFGQKCVLIVIDTLARAMGGGDENTAVDMSKLVGHSDRLRAATGATVDLIHHTGKDASKGARGSSALRAATDTEIEIGEGVFEAKKQRDMAKVQPINFELVDVEIGARSDGKKISACVVRWLAPNEFDDRLSPQAAEMLSVLERLLAARRDEIAEDDSIPETEKIDKIAQAAIPWKRWETVLSETLRGPRGKPLGRTHLYPLRQELTDSGRILKNRRNEWHLK